MYVFSNFIPDFDTKVCIKKTDFRSSQRPNIGRGQPPFAAHPVSCQSMQAVMSAKKKEGGRGGNTEIPPSAVQEEQSPVLSPAGKKGKEGHLFYCKHTICQQLLHEPHILKLRLQIPVKSRKNPPNRMKRVEIGRQNAPDTDI